MVKDGKACREEIQGGERIIPAKVTDLETIEAPAVGLRGTALGFV